MLGSGVSPSQASVCLHFTTQASRAGATRSGDGRRRSSVAPGWFPLPRMEVVGISQQLSLEGGIPPLVSSAS